MNELPRLPLVLLFGILLTACSTIATYDQTAYTQAVNAKVDALAVMSKANSSYSGHKQEVDALYIELQKAYEYDKGRPLNNNTVAQWEILLDPHHDLLGGFLVEWKDEGSVLPAYVSSKKTQIGKAFDQIIQLESGKIKN